MTLKPLNTSTIRIEPSKSLYRFISDMTVTKNMPEGLLAICNNRKPNDCKQSKHKLLLTKSDKKYIHSLRLEEQSDESSSPVTNLSENETVTPKHAITLEDLHWLNDYIVVQNETGEKKVYMHELFEGSQVILPENEETIRNPELEKRCVKLRAQQENMRYNAMTKNIDSVRKRHPEDTIAFQVKEMDKYLIVVAQFIMSVLAGFAFGFIGLELIFGNLDFGFRLLLGIIAALVIAIAELYFILRKLDRESKLEEQILKSQ